MGQLSFEKQAILRQLTQTAPDAALYSLERALSGSADDPSLSGVCALVSAEAHDRRLRDRVFEPLLPLFTGFAEGRIRFPPRMLRSLWTALEALRPLDAAAAARLCAAWDPETSTPDLFDALCAAAAQALRTQPSDAFAALAAEPTAPDLIACLDLAAVVRAALPHLGDWVTRMNDDRRAAIRLAYKDAVEVSDDAGPLFFDVMDAHLGEPWRILRVISAAMDRPGEVYLAGSELAPFALRALDDIDAKLAHVRTFDPADGRSAGRAAGGALLAAANALAEFEDAIELSRERPWGKGVAARRKTLAAAAEARIAEIEAAVDKALPMAQSRLGRKVIERPKLELAPDEGAVTRAMSLLAFTDEVRSGAGNGGFGSVRTRVLEQLQSRLDAYIEDVLHQLRAGEVSDVERAQYYLAIVADLYALAKDEKAAQIVRRRAATAVWTGADARASA